MLRGKWIDKVALAAVVLAMLAAAACLAVSMRTSGGGQTMGYEDTLFDTAVVHSIDIVMEDWDAFIASCEDEEYRACTVTVDGENMGSVGIRAKGNTSLSSVSAMGSDRYSFKIEFDQYETGKTYRGLDKLSLNNLIQDNTYMKDYLTYTMMRAFGAAAPLCSYVEITVNGEPWGLYLAVEAVEESFLLRNYGADYGDLYKPDTLGFGGGRGNGKDFNMEDFFGGNAGESGEESFAGRSETGDSRRPSGANAQQSSGFDPAQMGGNMQFPGGFDPTQMGGNMQLPGNFDPAQMGGDMQPPADFDFSRMGGGMPGGFGGMGGSDGKLQYIDDNAGSYATIFSSAKTDVTEQDQQRLIAALKTLGEGEIESAVDVDAALRYFVVHNFVVNGDSYTGSMVHNYYLYEEDGKLTMLPWDYNLAFGTFMGGSALSAVNDPIDSPLSVSGSGDRPMADWIVADEAYTALYHQYFAAFLESVDAAGIVAETAALVAPYVEADATRFCTVEEFEAAADALERFCRLRTESVLGQLAGIIPTTDAAQKADGAALVAADGLDLSDMGSMGGGFGGFGDRDSGERPARDETDRQPPDTATRPTFDSDSSAAEGPGASFRPNRGGMGEGRGPSGAAAQQSGDPSALVLTAVSLAVLAAALVIVRRWRR